MGFVFGSDVVESDSLQNIDECRKGGGVKRDAIRLQFQPYLSLMRKGSSGVLGDKSVEIGSDVENRES